MPAKGILLLRFAMFCGSGFIAGHAAHGQFLEPPDTNLFGSDFVKTFDIRAGGIVMQNDNRAKKPAKIEGYEGLLLFRDGRQLRGRMVSIGQDEIIWKRPDFSEPLHFQRTDVRRAFLSPGNGNGVGSIMPNAIRFVSGPRSGRRGVRSAIAPATIKLSGNDWLRGDVISPDGQSFVLRLDNKGSSIAAPRSQVEWLYFDWNTAQGGGFDGNILNAEDWLASAPSASLANDGTLVISGENEWFGRILPQAPRFEISMEIPADSEQGTHLWLQPFAPTPNTFTVGAVDMAFGPKRLALQRFTNAMEQKNFPVSNAGMQDAKGIVRYRIFYDSDKHWLVVFRNDKNVVDWKPDAPKPGEPANTMRPEVLTYLMRMALPNIVIASSMGTALHALQPPVEGLCLASVPQMLATASYTRFAAQLLTSELRSRFPRINGISLSGWPRDGDQDKQVLKLRRFQVKPWDGTLPQNKETVVSEDQLASAALGTMSGKLESITDKDVIFSQQIHPKLPGLLLRLPHESGAQWDAVARVGLGAAGELGVSSLEIRDGTAHLHTAFADDLQLPATTLNAISFPTLEPRSEMKGDSLVFKNGDELPGALISAAQDAPLRWKMAGGEELAVESKNVAGVRFATPAPLKIPAGSGSLELRNGDCLRGGVVSFDKNQLRFQEPLLGPLSVDRSRIWKLFPQAGAGIRDGADNPVGWMTAELKAGPFLYINPMRSGAKIEPRLAWLYFDGCYLPRPSPRQNGEMEVKYLSSPAPVQQDGLFEVRAEITAVGGNLLNAMISIAGKQNENGGASAISINFSGMEMYVNVVNGARPQGNRQVALGEKIGKLSTRLSFRVFVNSVLGTADVMLNGKLVARIGQQPDERAPGIDQSVQFGGFSYDGQPMVFSNLWIGPWDGELPRAETAVRASTALSNGDVTANIPSALKDGKYLLESEVGPLQLPAASVSAIAFGGETAQTRCAARLRLVDGSVVHVTSFACQDRTVASHSELFGDLHLPLESIAEIVLDPEPLRAPLGPSPKKPAQATAAALEKPNQ
jgi:hypothetical protein